ncbi:MAG: type II toxin-antitoxin system HicB family antitoxin [Sulfuricellaceae bacterium]
MSLVNNDISYKGYSGSIETNIEDQCLHGRILFIDDLITYEGDTVHSVVQAFQDAVDRYLAYCARTGKPANKPHGGTFNVRIGKDRHREAAKCARNKNISINELICLALDHELHHSKVS